MSGTSQRDGVHVTESQPPIPSRAAAGELRARGVAGIPSWVRDDEVFNVSTTADATED